MSLKPLLELAKGLRTSAERDALAVHVLRKHLWGYVDERDVAGACRLALEAPAEAAAGSPPFIIAAAGTVMNRPSAGLLAEVFPTVPLAREVGEFGTLLAIDLAQ